MLSLIRYLFCRLGKVTARQGVAKTFPLKYRTHVADDTIEWGIHYAGTDSVLWPNPKSGPWRVQCTWANVDGYTRLIEVNVTSDTTVRDGKLTQVPITASTLRDLPLDHVAGLVLQKVRKTAQSQHVGPGDPGEILGTYVEGGKTGRRPLTTEQLAQVASIYRAAPTKPTKAVADALGISSSAAAKRVVRAREAGLLESTSQGRAGGPSASKSKAQPKRRRTK